MKTRPLLLTSALLAAGLTLTACTATASLDASASSSPVTDAQTVSTASFDLAPAAVRAENNDYTTVNEREWSEADAVDVALSGSSLEGSAAGVTTSASTVTITEAGVYRITGSFTGQLRVEAPEDALVVLLLDGVDISNASGAAIEVISADDVAIHLADGSVNSVTDGANYAADATANAAIYADSDLTISGTGELTVQGLSNDGITSKDDLVILGGTISVTAADDALRGKDALAVEGGTLSLTAAGGDGLKSDGDDGDDSADIDWAKGYIYLSGGEIDVTAGDDGVQAFTDVVIAGGSLTVSAADDGVKAEVIVSIGPSADGADADSALTVHVTESYEGIEAANIGISAGVVDVTASDDGINASGNAELQALIAGETFTGVANREADSGERLEITGGTVTVIAGFDGLDSNGTVTISGGAIDITSADNGGDGPIDGNGTVTVAEGLVTANGSAYDPASANAGPGGGQGGGPGGPGGGAPNAGEAPAPR